MITKKTDHLTKIDSKIKELLELADIPAELKLNIKNELDKLNLLHIENIGNQLSIGVFICDVDGVIQYINKTNETIMGIKSEDCVGRSTDYMVKTFGIQNIAVPTVLKTKEAYSSIVKSPITGTSFLSIGAPVYDTGGELCGVIVIDQDLSLIDSLTRQLDDMETKTIYYKEIINKSNYVINQLNQQDIVRQKHFTEEKTYTSAAMTHAYHMAKQAAKTDVVTLLIGETGCGKEVIANYIFEHSKRSNKPFIKVNCAAIPDHLLESELFGYVKGAFTGANAGGKMGMFELANTGTLFLDEIGDLPYDFQAKLLRAIQQQEISKVGDTKVTKLDIRIIAATNRNLKKMMEEGTFRSDLYYRLNTFPIEIPPLRERKEDFPVLVKYFLSVFNKRYKKNITMTSDVISKLASYDWPGNVRELENMMERWVVIYDDNTNITWTMIKSYFTDADEMPGHDFSGCAFKDLVADYEKKILMWAFSEYTSTRAIARALSVDHSTIVRKAKLYGISAK